MEATPALFFHLKDKSKWCAFIQPSSLFRSVSTHNTEWCVASVYYHNKDNRASFALVSSSKHEMWWLPWKSPTVCCFSFCQYHTQRKTSIEASERGHSQHTILLAAITFILLNFPYSYLTKMHLKTETNHRPGLLASISVPSLVVTYQTSCLTGSYSMLIFIVMNYITEPWPLKCLLLSS